MYQSVISVIAVLSSKIQKLYTSLQLKAQIVYLSVCCCIQCGTKHLNECIRQKHTSAHVCQTWQAAFGMKTSAWAMYVSSSVRCENTPFNVKWRVRLAQNTHSFWRSLKDVEEPCSLVCHLISTLGKETPIALIQSVLTMSGSLANTSMTMRCSPALIKASFSRIKACLSSGTLSLNDWRTLYTTSLKMRLLLKAPWTLYLETLR